MKLSIAITLLFAILSSSLAAQSNDGIGEIVAQMSVEEKAELTVGLLRKFFPPTNSGFAARTTPLERYGIPSIVLADGTAGVRLSRRGPQKATAFPDNMAVASSWNKDVAYSVGAAAGFEARGYNANILLAPGMNIIRNPLNGRNFEYFSEDPVITGKMGAAYVSGIQSNGVACSAKHFTCNNQETNRSFNDVRVGMRAFREIYLRGFEICVREAAPWTIMSSYNSLNGDAVQESRWLLNGILRGEWGFDGLVMTDWTTRKHDTVAQLYAGNDLFMPGDRYQVEEIVEAVKNGKLSESELDRACSNVMRLVKRCSFPVSESDPDLAPGAEASFKAACEGAVLLENNGMLPLLNEGKAALFGVRSYNLIVTGNGAGFVSCPPVSEIGASFREAGIEIDSELEDLYTKYVAFSSADMAANEKIKVHIGKPLLPELEISRCLVEKAAERNDYAVITLGRSAGEGVDRTLDGDYLLTPIEIKLLEDVCDIFHSKGKKVAVVLNIAGVIDFSGWKDLPDAILCIWLPGQEGGKVVHALMTGKKTPSGKLAVSIAKNYSDIPGAKDFPYDAPTEGRNYDYTEYNEGVFVGYRHYSTRGVDVQYPFGYGLSYTSFEHSDMKVKSTNKGITVSVKVTNVGCRCGKEALGIYVGAPSGGLDKPLFELKSFAKTSALEPGGSETLTFEVPESYLKSYDEELGKWESASGNYLLYLGADVTKLKQIATVRRR